MGAHINIREVAKYLKSGLYQEFLRPLGLNSGPQPE